VLRPDDHCTKTGPPVLEVLQEKHPELHDPPIYNRNTPGDDDGAFEAYEGEAPAIIPADIVELVAATLFGSAGLGGTNAVNLHNWLLHYSNESLALHKKMTKWTMWLANDTPPWPAYHALMAARLVVLDKQPGVRPVGIGKIYHHLMAKCLLAIMGNQVTTACDNLNLCASLQAGIEGAVHAMGDAWEEAERRGGHIPSTPINPTPVANKETALPIVTLMPYATLLVDTRNRFNKLSRKAALWTVRHRCLMAVDLPSTAIDMPPCS